MACANKAGGRYEFMAFFWSSIKIVILFNFTVGCQNIDFAKNTAVAHLL